MTEKFGGKVVEAGFRDGNDNPEILLDEVEDAAVVFNFKFTNCLIRFDNRNE